MAFPYIGPPYPFISSETRISSEPSGVVINVEDLSFLHSLGADFGENSLGPFSKSEVICPHCDLIREIVVVFGRPGYDTQMRQLCGPCLVKAAPGTRDP